MHQHEKQFRKNIDNGEIKPFPLIKSLADMGRKVSHRDVKEIDGKRINYPPFFALFIVFVVYLMLFVYLHAFFFFFVIFLKGGNKNALLNRAHMSAVDFASRNKKQSKNKINIVLLFFCACLTPWCHLFYQLLTFFFF